MQTLELDKLSSGIDNIMKKLEENQRQVDYLKQRESKLVAENRELQQRLTTAQQTVQKILGKLKSVEAL